MNKAFSISAKKGKFFELTYDEQEYVLHAETVVKHQLLLRKTLEDKMLKEILKDDRFYQTLDYALGLLSKKAYSSYALKKAIKRPENLATIDRVIEELKTLGYLNDDETLKLLLEELIHSKRLGPNMIKERLKKEGFDAHETDRALALYQEKDREENAHYWLLSVQKQNPNVPSAKLKTKCLQKGLMKGFDYDMLETVTQAIVSESKTPDEEELLRVAMEKMRKRYNLNDAKDKQRCIQKLLRDGFRYDTIKNVVK